ncbi:beta-defensin 134 [Otolemur garnettii]|uniref:beta-defensin 134 n=1 Tax=Otolemur garnettii TaxID=30611 RepID=UPI000C7F07FF|nr:beta-defensin 134 [Otolemur garnettii]
MKPLLILLAFLSLWDLVMAGYNLFSLELHRKCHRGGTCRLECYGSEMLIAYCLFHLECCRTGHPPP